MSQLVFDDNLADQLDTLYHKRDILRRRAHVREAVGAQPRERILDVGCGPGFYVAELLDEVGAEGSVLGVDVSPQMLAIAAKRCEGRANVEFREGPATKLPVEDASVDAALSVQVLEYVADTGAALAEIHRAVRPGGRVVLWDVDWGTLSWHSADQERMARALRAWDAHLAQPSLPRTLGTQLRAAGFEDVTVAAHAFIDNAFHSEAYIAATLPLIEDYLVGSGLIEPDEAHAWADEQRELGPRGEYFVSVLQFCFTARRPEQAASGP
jgi:ubiquinone/menaquinone biosynthesis C-methylase UbiE